MTLQMILLSKYMPARKETEEDLALHEKRYFSF